MRCLLILAVLLSVPSAHAGPAVSTGTGDRFQGENCVLKSEVDSTYVREGDEEDDPGARVNPITHEWETKDGNNETKCLPPRV